MGKSTTTSDISILDNGIVVNKLFSHSAFKEPYILEQGLHLDYLCNGEEKPLLLDASNIYSSVENIKQMISHNRFYSAKSVAVLINSKVQKQVLLMWAKILKPQFPVKFFINRGRAVNWLESYC